MMPSDGTVMIHGEAVREPRVDTGLVFQSPTLLPWSNILDNLLFPYTMMRRPITDEARGKAHDLLALTGLDGFASRYPMTREEMSRELLKICERRPKTVLFVTHSIAESVLLSDRVVVMSPRPGRIVESITVPLERTNRIGMETSHDFQACAGHIRDLFFGYRHAAA